MPWCPVCHAEYREGVKVCRECQAELVDTPPAAGEHYEPPAESALDTMAEAVTQRLRGRGWGGQFVDGFRLFGESFPLMWRMRNLWLVLAIFIGLATVSALRPPLPMDAATLAMMRETGTAYAAGMGWYGEGGWSGLMTAIDHVRQDLDTGLSTPLAYFAWRYGRFTYRAYPTSEATRNAWKDPRLWAGALALTLFSVLFAAGVLHWVLAAVRGEAQTAARLWHGIRQSFWPLLAWLIVYRALWYALTWPTYHVSHTGVRLVFLTATGLLLFPLLFTSKVIVVQHPPLRWAPVDSARIFGKNLLLLLGFAIPFIVLHDFIWGADGALRYYLYSAWDPDYAYRHAMPPLAIVLQVAKVTTELLITTAFVTLVARWKEADQSEPAQPEAASA